jgi:hypothetical protein
MPSRAQIDPLELTGHLGSLLLAEPLPSRLDVRFRLVGTNIVDAYGRDATGRLLSEVGATMDADYHRCLTAAYRTVLARGVIVRGRGTLGVENYTWKYADVLLLPLDGGDDTVGMILGDILFAPQLALPLRGRSTADNAPGPIVRRPVMPTFAANQ